MTCLFGMISKVTLLTEARPKESSLKEETCNPLTDEEFKEYQEKDARTTKRVLGFFSAIWEAIVLFFS